jgi:hypothetical protein
MLIETAKEGPLPSPEERRKILERARQVLLEARAVMDLLDQTQTKLPPLFHEDTEDAPEGPFASPRHELSLHRPIPSSLKIETKRTVPKPKESRPSKHSKQRLLNLT